MSLSALRSFPVITFETFINFGYVQQGDEVKAELTFKNVGKSLGKVSIKFDTLQQIKVIPNFFELHPYSQINVDVYYKGLDMGTFRGTLDVRIEGEVQ